MESTCNRCHQPVPAESCYCPACGLPQLVYETQEGAGAAPPERWTGALRDASAVEWKPALRFALLLAIPACLISFGYPFVTLVAVFWMAAAPTWAVTLYVRRQHPAWITMGAGARIGLVTGFLAGWIAFAGRSLSLFAMRALGQGKDIDEQWQAIASQMAQQSQSSGLDPQSTALSKWVVSSMLIPEGRAGWMLTSLIMLEVAFLVFSAAGGALGAHLTARSRRPQS